MFKISKFDQLRWGKKAMPAIKRIVNSEEEQNKLVACLNDAGYPELAQIALEAKKYIPDAKKHLK